MSNGNYHLADAIDVIQEVLNGGGEFRLYPKGVSMLPLIRQERDSVVLRKRTDPNKAPVQKHEIAFYRRDNGQFVLHRVMKAETDGSYTMCGDNQLYLEKGVRADQIIGYVTHMYKKEKLVRFTSVFYRIYLLFWCWMPFRHAIMLPKRTWNWMKRKIVGKA